MLDNRLKMCADMVGGTGTVCDVGTDHAYLAAELILSGKCSRVIASDIKEGPLDAAKSTVERYGITDKVELVLSDGLENVDLSGVSDIVIAGMGGETIVKIIEKCDKKFDGIQFILQPMTKPEILRKWLYKANFSITAEKAVEESGKLYTVITAQRDIAPYRELTESESIAGFFYEDDEIGKKYRIKESERLAKASEQLKIAKKYNEATHFSAMSKRLLNDDFTINVDDIFKFLDEKYPFSLQEKWDNSGFLVKSWGFKCKKILLTLDITNSVVREASHKGIELIISHHPIIFEPLKKIERFSPVFELVQRDISAICLHTNLDIAEGGTNGVILEKLRNRYELACDPEPFEDCGDGRYLGWIVTLKDRVKSRDFAQNLKDIFGCEYVRAARDGNHLLSRIAICSGSGGSMADLAIEKKCDALVTGDVKHDVWIKANNRSFAVFDCGHFHTENLVLPELRRVLEEKFPLLDVEIAEDSTDPCVYF